MSDSLADRDLLIGVFAFQLGFVSRRQFVAAVGVWLNHDSSSLGEILELRGAISGDQRLWLESLARDHLLKHGGQFHRSLAALESSFSLRADLRRLQLTPPETSPSTPPDAVAEEVAAHLPSLESQTRASGQPVDTGPRSNVGHESTPRAWSTRSNRQRFRVLRTYAEGALGCVSVARDEEFQRDVAIKEIKPQFAQDPASRSRFALEAEVTQALDHPGIAPVYGIGHYEDGRPFYAMRFVKGQSLKEAINKFYEMPATPSSNDRFPAHDHSPAPAQPAMRTIRARDFHSVDFRKLVGQLVDVCHAMEFAHRRGVLHRDIKPSNIMLGEHGETVIVDWGLAKVAGRADASHLNGEGTEPVLSGSGSVTQVGAVIGTPAYMSPEQAAGNRDGLGPETDVYGLGATLYQVITGRAPLRKLPLKEMLTRVQAGDFPSPRQVNRHIPRPLEAICRKAMALRPQERYKSAAELGEELEQWLADEPIQAYDEGQLVKSARWVRHNMATYTLVLVLFLGSAIIYLGAKCRQLQARHDRVEQLRQVIRSDSRESLTEVADNAVAALAQESLRTTRRKP